MNIYPYRDRLHEDFVQTQEGNRSTKKPLTQHEIVRNSITEANVKTQTPITPKRKKSQIEDENCYNFAMMDISNLYISQTVTLQARHSYD
jgi:hypothetical protein